MMKQRVSVALLGALVLALLASQAAASHWRFGTGSWRRQADTAAGNPVVRLDLKSAWRIGSIGAFGMASLSSSAAILSVLAHGPGATPAPGTLPYFVTGADAPITSTGTDAAGEDYEVRDYFIEMELAGLGPITFTFSTCCRISNLQNGADGSFAVNVVVDLNDADNSGGPVATVPVLVGVVFGAVNTFSVTAIDPENDVLAWSVNLTPTDLAPHPPQSPGAGSAAVVHLGGDQFQWDLSTADATSVGNKYGMEVLISETGRANPSTTMVDFILEIQEPAEVPTCRLLQSNPTSLIVGTTYTWVAFGDSTNDPIDLFSSLGVPAGASVVSVPNVGVLGDLVTADNVTTTVMWTAVAGQVGVMQLTYTNTGGRQATCNIPFNTPAVPFCGDGIVNQASEQCDDGQGNGPLPAPCSLNCQLNMPPTQPPTQPPTPTLLPCGYQICAEYSQSQPVPSADYAACIGNPFTGHGYCQAYVGAMPAVCDDHPSFCYLTQDAASNPVWCVNWHLNACADPCFDPTESNLCEFDSTCSCGSHIGPQNQEVCGFQRCSAAAQTSGLGTRLYDLCVGNPMTGHGYCNEYATEPFPCDPNFCFEVSSPTGSFWCSSGQGACSDPCEHPSDPNACQGGSACCAAA